jgi:hypothetical protein
MDNLNDLIPNNIPSSFSDASQFASSNTLVAKIVFLILVIFVFSFLYYMLSWLISYIFSPNESPYILYGMKDATEPEIIPQDPKKKNNRLIFRSKNEDGGIEFSYSFWMYIKDEFENIDKFKHVFHKGSPNGNSKNDGTYGPLNAPGVYLYKGAKSDTHLENDKSDKVKQMNDQNQIIGMLVRLNIHNNNDKEYIGYKYYDNIYVDNLPIKKWIHVVIKSTNQNIIDIYINGNLVKRHNLSNVVKQNYDDIYINLEGGFDGNLSNLKYYNYAIDTFEIDRISKNGPNLKMAKKSNLSESKPSYLSNNWYDNNL